MVFNMCDFSYKIQEYFSRIVLYGMNKDASPCDIYEILDSEGDSIHWKAKFKFKYLNTLILLKMDQNIDMKRYFDFRSFYSQFGVHF